MKNVLNVPNLDTSLLAVGRTGNGAGSGRVALIPTPPHLFKTIFIPVPFKKLNGRGRYDKFSYPSRPV